MRRRDLVMALGLAAVARPGLARPSAGWAPQEGPGPLIGFIHGSAPVAQYNGYIAAFLDGLKEEGFEHRKDVLVEYRWAEGQYERVPTLAAELLATKPKMIVAYGPPNLLRAAVDSVPRDMPVVFGTGGDRSRPASSRASRGRAAMPPASRTA